ncbi:putative FMNH2-utilizing oxygenase [Actinoplanes ianthinogenes]|uniref:FMNH2-utilizing oxygenase n=1 Tax=Actinoplanes ianthinogenes TaxID=122358 RepID=A0ABN6CMV7_9ACTN|nr:LLM class flavin-dependent oxidoreductase [Actinoplanes ianthinogenes]BCJ46451.1 putative FMNH2-utilizing oxygenase [Actinoplanes ianthinogenes]GGR34344.1 putative FMNH2-utilizing oxygenase [Actinoplanes ianthinogenes]
MFVAVALDGDSFAARDWADVVRQADDARVDLVTFDDDFGRHGPDAVLTAARVAPLTRHVGLVPVATTTHTEPFHLSTALATLDHVSNGRAGWQVRVSTDPAEAALLGRRAPLERDELFAEAADAVEVVRRLWDSWQDDAIIKDVATGRYIDRDRLHYTDFAGRYFSVKGPSIVPRPPQGQPVVAVADGEAPDDAADVVFVADRLAGPRPGRKVFADVPVREGGNRDAMVRILAAAAAGVDGVRLRGDLLTVIRDLIPELRWRGLFHPSHAATLRERLGLPPAINRYELPAPA